jgi:predicted transcriptional regulator
MEVQNIEFGQPHPIDNLLQIIDTKVGSGYVNHQTSVGKGRKVVDVVRSIGNGAESRVFEIRLTLQEVEDGGDGIDHSSLSVCLYGYSITIDIKTVSLLNLELTQVLGRGV